MENKEIEAEAAEREKDSAAVKPGDEGTPKHAPGEIWLLGLMFLITLALFVDSLKLEGIFTGLTNPNSLPQLFILAIFFLIILVTCGILFRDKFRERGLKEAVRHVVSRDVIVLLAMVLAYGVLLPFAHFTVTSLVFLFGTMYLLDRRKPLHKVFISVGVVAAILVIFHYLMQVVLP
ncbi:tripartite tricarboxylate transporter TctB family protein [Caproicibacter sp. BJN0012]|uniref:tripartite tricarboxylate transporter TctB family protein n=1 Tax=Caproicibacter sp. BJN0012 TaxID=3110227 RepID=UPI002E0EC1C0